MRYYSNVAVATTLENPGGITPTSTQLTLLNTTGYPTQYPFSLRLDPDTAKEEIVTVNSGGGSAGNPYIVTRGADGTVAKSHSQYSVVTHGFSARDLAEPQVHMEDLFKHARRPQFSTQAAAPPFNQNGVFVNFTSAAWPAISFTSPPSGVVEITVGGAVFTNYGSSAAAWVNYRISGGLTLEGAEGHGVSASAGARVYASRTFVHSGMTPGVLTTVTPTWNISSGGASTSYIGNGQLIVKLHP